MQSVEPNAEQAQPASPPADEPAVEDVLAEHVAEEQLDSAIDEITDAIGSLLEAHHCAPLELRDDSPHADREDTVALETEHETQFDEDVEVEVAVDTDVDASTLGEGDVLIELEADDEAQTVAAPEDAPEASVEPELQEPAESALVDEPEPTETIEPGSEVDSTNDESAEVDVVTETTAPEEQSASVFEANLAEALDAALQAALTEQPHEVAASPAAAVAIAPAASIAPVAPTPAHIAEPQPVEVHVQLDVQPLEAPLQQIQAALQKLADGQPSPQMFAPLADSIAASIRSLQETIREAAERAQQDDRIDRIHATLEDMTDALGALRHAESQRARATERRLQRAERRQPADSPDDGRGAILVAGSVAIVGWIAAMWLHAHDLRLALGALVAANFVSLFVLARRRSD